jgi:hypothetical protein
MKFKTTKEFTDYIKADRHEYAEEPEDLEVRHAALKCRYEKEIALTGFKLRTESTPDNTSYSVVIQNIVEEFYGTLPDVLREPFETRFYFTTIDNRALNASITRSPDDQFYSVFIYTSLITALHRLGKLELAMHFPESVDSCSRCPGEQVTREKMTDIYLEVYEYFKETKIPHGPQVLLKDPLNSHHLLKLDIQEKLIIFHEIAHFLNGDLNKNPSERPLFDAFPNLDYQKEHLADIVGFALLFRQFKHSSSLTRELRYYILIALIDLFKMQHLIQGIETEKYPHPLNRMQHVIEKFYGLATEEWVADAILNSQYQKLTFENFPQVETEEEMIIAYVDEQLSIAFNN